MSGPTRLAYALDDALTRALRRRAERRARREARGVRVDRALLRGHGCHCPPGLPVHFVHSEGLREACDVVVDWGSNVEHPRRPQLPVELMAHVGGEIRRGDAVHVKTDLLDRFVAHVLPSIREPFVLVTGDSDAARVVAFRHLLDDRRVAHWFAQNCDVAGRHAKLTRVPIGVDNPVYTKLDKRLGFALAMLLGRMPWDPTLRRNDIGDQATLARIRARQRPVADKPPRALCTFHRNGKLVSNVRAVPGRAAAVADLAGNPACHFVRRRLRQDACWAVHDDFAFEVAPRGNGLDTFRTWEALALGTIPIVQASTLDPLFEDEGFPVVVVASFREVTPDALRTWQRERAAAFGPAMEERLTNGYWVGRIRATQARLR